jgi:hypothetical protein
LRIATSLSGVGYNRAVRLPRSKVYRAFPELDAFDDEKCRRFVQEAGRVWGGLWVRVPAQILAALATLFVSTWVARELWTRLDSYIPVVRSDIVPVLGPSAIGGVIFFATGMAFLRTRDVLLRRSVRRVMGRRGSCPGCRYGLTSLPVVDGIVICPECGVRVQAEDAVGEIVTDTQGIPRFLPSPFAAPAQYRRFSPEQLRKIRRMWYLAAALVFAVIVGLPALYELRVRSTTSRARRDQVTWKEYDALIRSQHADDPEAGPVALNLINETVGFVHRIEVKAGLNEIGHTPTYSALYLRRMTQGLADDEVLDMKHRAWLCIQQLRAAGFTKEMDAIIACRRTVSIGSQPPAAPVSSLIFGTYGYAASGLFEINTARMMLAREERAREESVSAFEANAALYRIMVSQPLPADRWFASYQWRHTSLEACRTLTAHPDQAWVKGLGDALRRHPVDDGLANAMPAVRLVVRDLLAHTFAETNLVRFGRLHKDYANWVGFSPNTPWNKLPPLGSYSANRAEVERWLTQMQTALALEPWLRGGPGSLPPPPSLPAAAQGVEVLSLRYVDPADEAQNTRRALGCVIALELHRVRTGAYPAQLKDLVPGELAELPLDNCSGKPFAYRLTPGVDPGYTLYSFGPDLADDGGRTTPAGVPGQPTTSGVDDVFVPVPLQQ